MKARKVNGLEPDGALAENLELTIRVRLDELLSFRSAVLDPGAVRALHDMRIAAKRLRYILELAAPVFGEPARRGARAARSLQDVLGEIHDCDETIPTVERRVAELRRDDAASVRALAGDAPDLDPALVRSSPHRRHYRGLEALDTYLRARRELLYARFMAELAELERAGFRQSLLDGCTAAAAGR